MTGGASDVSEPSVDLGATGAIRDASDEVYVLGRGRFLGRLSRVGIVLIAATAGLLRSAEPASASFQYACCFLSHQPGGCPGGNNSNHWCPPGYTKRVWGCCYGGLHLLYVCSECTKGSSCFQGPYYCSAYWPTGATC